MQKTQKVYRAELNLESHKEPFRKAQEPKQLCFSVDEAQMASIDLKSRSFFLDETQRTMEFGG